MKLEFSNLGPIQYGEIDLSKKITAFVGYNSSGKTYVSQLVWGVYQVLDSYLFTWGLSYFANFIETLNFDIESEILLDETVIDGFRKFVNKNLNDVIVDEIFGASDAKIVGENFSLNLSYDISIATTALIRDTHYRISDRSNSSKNPERIEVDSGGPEGVRLVVNKHKDSNKLTSTFEVLTYFPVS